MEKRAAEKKYREEEEDARKWQKITNDETRKVWGQHAHFNQSVGCTCQSFTSTCCHNGWWPKLQGHTACPECNEIWTYLLQCSGCKITACPRCQGAMRQRKTRNVRTTRRGPLGVRTPSSDLYDYDYQICGGEFDRESSGLDSTQ